MSGDRKRILFVGATVKDSVYFSNNPLTTRAGKFNMVSRKTYTGGSGANASIAASQLSRLQNLGFDIVLSSKIGGGLDESLPTALKIRNRGITISDAIAEQDDHEIPVNTVESASDDRRILVYAHQYPEIDPGYAEEFRALVRHTDMVQIHTRIPDLALMAAEIARKEDVPIAIDASSYDPILDEIMPYATFGVLPDELELPGMDSNSAPDAQAIMDYIRRFDIPYAAVMRGGADTLYHMRDGQSGIAPVHISERFKMVDKLGAGDAARGAMMVALQSGWDFPDALVYANLIGTYSCAYNHREWIDALEREGERDLQRVTGYYGHDDTGPEFAAFSAG